MVFENQRPLLLVPSLGIADSEVLGDCREGITPGEELEPSDQLPLGPTV